MEVIIKIPDEMLEAVKINQYCGTKGRLESIIANGIPLPKGHGRLIDVNTLVASLEKDKREAFTKHQVWLMFSAYNKDVPTIVEAE